MKSYSVVKAKAQKFADERQYPVFIAKAKHQNHYKIEFQYGTTPNYDIIETVIPRMKDQMVICINYSERCGYSVDIDDVRVLECLSGDEVSELTISQLQELRLATGEF